MKSKCINRVELRGAVGTVRINETGEGRIARFSLPDFDNDSPNSLTRVCDPFN